MSEPGPKPASVLILGSGPVVIGQAAEFDYAGTQACRALRAEGVRTILINSNPATIMTDPSVADAIYLEPLTVEAVEAVIAKEQPEGLLAGLGGQTALNLATALARAGVFERHPIRLLGTPLEAIHMAEDREAFRDLLDRIGQPYAPSWIVEGARRGRERGACADTIGLPAIVRPAFTLGGTGGGIVETEAAYREIVRTGLRASPIGQVMVEKCLVGWQEIEYEVMRDADDTCIAVCSMENVDPLGVHTGDSIVVAPVQTLTDAVHQRLRSAALAIIRALGVEGGCNVQFALSPDSTEYAVIEVNPRVVALVGARAQGHRLPDRPGRGADRGRAAARRDPERRDRHDRRRVRAGARLRRRQAAALPVRQVPDRRPDARQPDEGDGRGDGHRPDLRVGAQQGAPRPRAGRGRAARRGPDLDADVRLPRRRLRRRPRGRRADPLDRRAPARRASRTRHAQRTAAPIVLRRFLEPSDSRLWRLLGLLRRGVPEAGRRRGDRHLGLVPRRDGPQRGAGTGRRDDRRRGSPTRPTPRPASSSPRSSAPGSATRSWPAWPARPRTRSAPRASQLGIVPGYAMVDTCAAEFAAETPYFYATYAAAGSAPEAPPVERPAALVIGCGPVRIGQGIEFDYCAVQAADTLRRNGWQAVMINSNPETVSTDFDASSRLYFEPLDPESVRSVIDAESPPRRRTSSRPSSRSAARRRSTSPRRWPPAACRCSAATSRPSTRPRSASGSRPCSTGSASRSPRAAWPTASRRR